MIRLAFMTVILAFCTHCTDGRPPVKADGDRPADAVTTTAQTLETAVPAASGTAPAQKAYVDPQTGELVTPPEPDAPAEAEGRAVQLSALGSSTEAMEEKPSPVKDGGMMIDLNGRFQNPLSATTDDKNTARIEHPSDDHMESQHATP